MRHSVRLDASLQLHDRRTSAQLHLHRRGGDHEQMNVGVLQSREHETSAEIHGAARIPSNHLRWRRQRY